MALRKKGLFFWWRETKIRAGTVVVNNPAINCNTAKRKESIGVLLPGFLLSGIPKSGSSSLLSEYISPGGLAEVDGSIELAESNKFRVTFGHVSRNKRRMQRMPLPPLGLSSYVADAKVNSLNNHNASSLTDGWTAGSIEEKENGDLINQKLDQDQVFLGYRLAGFAFAAVCMVAAVDITGNTLVSVAVNTKCSPININASNWSYMMRGWDALPALWVLTQFGEQWPSLICVYVWYFITTTAFALLDMSIAIVQQQYNLKLHVHGNNTPNSFTCRVSVVFLQQASDLCHFPPYTRIVQILFLVHNRCGRKFTEIHTALLANRIQLPADLVRQECEWEE